MTAYARTFQGFLLVSNYRTQYSTASLLNADGGFAEPLVTLEADGCDHAEDIHAAVENYWCERNTDAEAEERAA